MAHRRFSVIWGGSERQPGDWRLGLWGTYDRTPGSRIVDVAISVRGLLRWAVAFAIAGYLAGVTALYFSLARSPYNLVTYADTLLLPVRWAQVQELRGRGLIEEGMADLKARRWGDAQMRLRLGLAKYPRDLRARLVLSQFLIASEHRPLALAVLDGGLAYGYPSRHYLETLFRTAAEGEDFEVIVEACDRFLATQKGDDHWLLVHKLQALTGARRADEALRIAEAQGNADAAINEARVMALLDLGRLEEAASFLGNWLTAFPAHRAQVVRLQARVSRELHQIGQMERALEELRALAPASPQPYVYGIVQRWLAGETAPAAAALERYFLRFGGSRANLQMVAEPLAEAKAAPLLQRCIDVAAEHGFATKPLKSALALVLLQQGEAKGAERILEELKPGLARDHAGEMFFHEWMRLMIGAATGPPDSPAGQLTALLQSRALPMRFYRLSIAALVRSDRMEAAWAVLTLAERRYPASRTLAMLQKDIGPARVTRQAKEPVSVATASPFRSEKLFFRQLEAAEKDGRWAEVAQSLRAARMAKPPWLSGREADVLHWQMRAGVETGDMLELLSAAKRYLDGSNDRAQRVLALVRRLQARGASGDAELLLAEVLRRSAGLPQEMRIHEEWEAAAAKTAPDGK
jgi:tetratricopeptide (TPR) repeat protein